MLQSGNIDIFPVFHYKLEFTQELRKQIIEGNYKKIYIELPFFLKDKILEAVNYLPAVSVVSYVKDEKESLLLVEPCDPFIEAIRTALELKIPLHFTDIMGGETTVHYLDKVPDSYCVYQMGYEKFLELLTPHFKRIKKSKHDKCREEHMAWELQQADEKEKALFVVGIAHSFRIKTLLDKKAGKPYDLLKFQKPDSIAINFLSEESVSTILLEGAYISSAYELSRSGKRKAKKKSVKVHESEFKQFKVFTTEIKEADKNYIGLLPVNKEDVINHLLWKTIEDYEKEISEKINQNSIKNFIKYCRNYARIYGSIVPSIYHLTISARNCFDDDFAFLLWQNATTYPWNPPQNKYNIRTVTLEDLGFDTKRIVFHKKELNKSRFFRKVFNRQEDMVTDDELNPHSICSYQPEDVDVENFGETIKQRAQYKLNEELTTTSPFITSLYDGIDFRETIKNQLFDQKIYVKEEKKIEEGFGSVVIIFDHDDKEEKYPYKMTWLGEHNQESDMAFYASEKEKKQIGPGIFECQYGGFLLSFPPGRLLDIWTLRELSYFENKYERLLAAGIAFSLDRYVVYVAPKKPSIMMQQFARLYSVTIIYMPLGFFPREKMRKIKTFHILSDKSKRKIAEKYIFR
ncbi:MAG: hypothetical protein HQK84_01005 [Nitrospinae bacterium]|nr:hypothetical protein [Nitrospinota bacterium]